MARRQKARGTFENAEDELLKAFARKVREARERTGLTRAQLGDLTGLAPSYLYESQEAELIARLDRLTQFRAALERLAPETKTGARRRVRRSL